MTCVTESLSSTWEWLAEGSACPGCRGVMGRKEEVGGRSVSSELSEREEEAAARAVEAGLRRVAGVLRRGRRR